MGSLADILSGPIGTLGFGGIAGAIVGFTAKKATKLAAIALGVIFILVQAMSYYGLIEIQWEAVQTTAEAVWEDEEGVTLAEWGWEVLTANLPFGGGFIAGFAAGFKLG